MAEGTEEQAAGTFARGMISTCGAPFPPSEPDGTSGSLPIFNGEDHSRRLPSHRSLSLQRGPGGLEITREGSEFYLRLGGRLFLDLAHYHEDQADLGPDGLGLRTLLLEAEGHFSKRWPYRLSLGGLTNGGRFDGSEAFLEDAYAAYLGAETIWTIGQHHEPFSLEELTSSLATTFMERGLPNALVPGRDIGLSVGTAGQRWSLNAGLFGEDLASSRDIAEQGYGLTARLVFRPETPPAERLHLGAAFSCRRVRGGDPVSYRSRPESGLTDVRYVNTGDILGADTVTRTGLEAALQLGPLSVQAEYVAAWVARQGGYDNLLFQGWYAFVSWFVTGESRRYLSREAVFGYPEVRSKGGAVELAARYSMVDLTDGSVLGGKERNVTFGLNWYLSHRMRLMANYILVFADANADDNGTVPGGDEPRILQMRWQFRF